MNLEVGDQPLKAIAIANHLLLCCRGSSLPGLPTVNVHPINSTVAASVTPTQRVLHRDYETRGILQLPKVGPWKYASNSRTEVRCCAYAVDDEPVQLWLPGDPVPLEFIEAARNLNWLVCAHNDAFETAIEQLLLHPRYGWPLIPIERHRCTQAQALAHALPGKLELAAKALDLIHQKDRAGARLMLMMSKPRRPHKDEDPNGLYWFEDEARLQRLYQYCKQDVEVERELYQRLRPLHPGEQQLWVLDHRINSRGFPVDRALGEAARAIAQAAGPEIDAELAQLAGEDPADQDCDRRTGWRWRRPGEETGGVVHQLPERAGA